MPQTTDLTAQPPAADRPPGAAKSGAKNPAKKTRNADATRDEILVAATREFAEKGLFGARVEEIAARTAASKHMIYYYFGSKDGLYSAVLEQAYADFRKAEAAIEYDTLGPVAAMEALVANTFASHVGNPHVIRIIMSENLDSGRHVSQMANVAQRELVLDTKQRIIDRGVAQGIFRKDLTALQLHLTISALCFHYVSNRATFGTLFQTDMTAPDTIEARRIELVKTVLARCLA